MHVAKKQGPPFCQKQNKTTAPQPHQGLVNFLNPSIYREPMVTLGQLVTFGQFMEKSVN